MRNYMVEMGLEDIAELPRKRKKRRERPEDHLQKCLIAYLKKRQRTREGSDLRFIVCQPERQRSMWRQAHDKSLGMQSGHPELLILSGSGVSRRLLLIEIKTTDGKMSDNQTDWREWVLARGWEHHIIRSVFSMEEILRGLPNDGQKV